MAKKKGLKKGKKLEKTKTLDGSSPVLYKR
jgi:hypothetical protein